MTTRRITPEEARLEQVASIHWRAGGGRSLTHAYERADNIHLKTIALCGLQTQPPFRMFIRTALVDEGPRCFLCETRAAKRT